MCRHGQHSCFHKTSSHLGSSAHKQRGVSHALFLAGSHVYSLAILHRVSLHCFTLAGEPTERLRGRVLTCSGTGRCAQCSESSSNARSWSSLSTAVCSQALACHKINNEPCISFDKPVAGEQVHFPASGDLKGFWRPTPRNNNRGMQET